MKILLFFFWSLAPGYTEGHESVGYKTWQDCQDMRLVYAAEGETTSECYARRVTS